jgi:hypothetical protein
MRRDESGSGNCPEINSRRLAPLQSRFLSNRESTIQLLPFTLDGVTVPIRSIRGQTLLTTILPRRRRKNRSFASLRMTRRLGTHALLLRPERSECVMMSIGGPGDVITPPPGSGTRSTSGRSRVVRRKPCPS